MWCRIVACGDVRTSHLSGKQFTSSPREDRDFINFCTLSDADPAGAISKTAQDFRHHQPLLQTFKSTTMIAEEGSRPFPFMSGLEGWDGPQSWHLVKRPFGWKLAAREDCQVKLRWRYVEGLAKAEDDLAILFGILTVEQQRHQLHGFLKRDAALDLKQRNGKL